MNIENGLVTFSTGREKRAHEGIIGLSPEMYVTDGYDGLFHAPKEAWMNDDYDGLTPAEQIELADYMIEQWQKFRALALSPNAKAQPRSCRELNLDEPTEAGRQERRPGAPGYAGPKP